MYRCVYADKLFFSTLTPVTSAPICYIDYRLIIV